MVSSVLASDLPAGIGAISLEHGSFASDVDGLSDRARSQLQVHAHRGIGVQPNVRTHGLLKSRLFHVHAVSAGGQIGKDEVARGCLWSTERREFVPVSVSDTCTFAITAWELSVMVPRIVPLEVCPRTGAMDRMIAMIVRNRLNQVKIRMWLTPKPSFDFRFRSRFENLTPDANSL